MVRSASGQATVYLEMSLASFVDGYLGIMMLEKSKEVSGVMLRHLRGLLQDVDVYGWRVVRDYHGAWLQLLEQKRATWLDEGERTELRRLMVWSKPSLASKGSFAPSSQALSAGMQRPPAPRDQGRYVRGYGQSSMATPGDRACQAFNIGVCQTPSAHPTDLHVCAYCLRVGGQLWRHSEVDCNCKAAAKNGAGGV